MSKIYIMRFFLILLVFFFVACSSNIDEVKDRLNHNIYRFDILEEFCKMQFDTTNIAMYIKFPFITPSISSRTVDQNYIIKEEIGIKKRLGEKKYYEIINHAEMLRLHQILWGKDASFFVIREKISYGKYLIVCKRNNLKGLSLEKVIWKKNDWVLFSIDSIDKLKEQIIRN